MKKLYSWILKWADTPYATSALFILAFFEAVFFPVPADILLIVLVLGCRAKAFTYAFFAATGSVSGAVLGYLAGHFLWVNATGEFTWFANLFFNNIPGFSIEMFNTLKGLYGQWDFLIVFTAGFTPVPYKIFTVTAGVFDMNLLLFLSASLISRAARFFLVSFLLWKFGQPVQSFFEKYFRIIVLGFTVCLVGGLVIVKLVI
jgi:membrane protein YqaA with SNARE-associated domain